MASPKSATSGRQSPDGVLIIDKPAGWTSHDVVARVRKLMKTRRVGHTGTLDPFATGVLVLCLNRATRLVQFMTLDQKEYLATMRLGLATDTGDLTGQPISEVSEARHITAEMVEAALAASRGRIKQVPPMYSAKKVAGVKLYELARRGQEIAREPVEIEIKELELCDAPTNAAAPASETSEIPTRDFSFRVVCSAGTYVRTLAEDLGARLGVGAHLTQLRRLRAGNCELQRSITLDRLAELTESGEVDETVISMSEVITLEEVRVGVEDCVNIGYGRPVKSRGEWLNGTLAKLCDRGGQLLAIAQYDADQQLWRPRVVLLEG
ncbi:MAG TPA: tRNA pseudouridine(55) synthase TruB [Blastocatellia bacterium]|nr:tRNA pseudouridine(55) synthase TruB [Blastocatellia bacterium]